MVAAHPGMSRDDIARAARMSPNNVSNRLRELELMGRIVRTGKKTDRLTGRRVAVWAAEGDPEARA